MTTWQRLFDATHAFDHPVTIGIVGAIVVGLLATSVLMRVLHAKGKLSDDTYGELVARTRSWYLLWAIMIVPILLGAACTIGFFLLLSLFCFREFAQATSLRRVKTVTMPVFVAISALYFAVIDHWPALFSATWALGVCAVAVIGLLPDQPQGYIRRVALAIVGFWLCGVSLAYLALFANDVNYRPILLWILLCTEMNDVFAYLSGKTFGRRKLVPHTSPNKTIGGAVGALLLTTLAAALIGHFVFEATPLGQPRHLLAMGLLISTLGQCGDLVMSSIKRDLGVKDMAATIPGHGGLLDRFDSLLIVSPCLFHYLNYFSEVGIGENQPTQIISRWFAG